MPYPRFALFAGLLLLQQTCLASPSCAPFDSQTLTFAGTPLQQADCLVRGLHEWGHLDKEPAQVPAPLDKLVGNKVEITVAQYRAYLKAQGIDEADIGGSLEEKLSRGNSNSPDAPEAGYFVIHDTSTPSLGRAPFPANMNSAAWPFNQLRRDIKGKPELAPGCVKSPDPKSQPVAHVFINRLGQSVTPVDFSLPWRATKFESENDCRAKGLFVHTEMVQPRRSDPREKHRNDALSPAPGFTPAQYRRLAIVYIAASIRKGSWLVPSFHATLDEGISDGHDDPQGFSLSEWAQALDGVLAEVGRVEPAR